MSSTHFVKLEKFEGPLDLLLHLIKVHEMEIFDIDLLVLTIQYLEYLRLVQFRNLTEAALFMDMAAQLCEIKSRRLLPTENKDGEDPKENDEISEDSLQNRLVLYDTFRKASDFFSQKIQIGFQVRTSQEWKRLEPQYEDIEAPLKGNSTVLLVLYEQMLASLSERKASRVQALTESVTVEQIMEKIKSYLENLRCLLLEELYQGMGSRYELIAYILGALQLTRDRKLKLHQEVFMGPLWLYSIDTKEEERPWES
jgi:segregation and condensation protein A